jgi:hypothetical protein
MKDFSDDTRAGYYITINQLLRHNTYPPTNESTSPGTPEETSALTEARGGVVEAWRQYVLSKTRSIAITVQTKDADVLSQTEWTVFDGKFTFTGDSYVEDKPTLKWNSTVLYFPWRFQGDVKSGGKLRSPSREEIFNSLDFVNNFYHFVWDILYHKQKSFIDEMIDSGWVVDLYYDETKGEYGLYLSSSTSRLGEIKYPPGISEDIEMCGEEESLLEARGGVKEAWYKKFCEEFPEGRAFPIHREKANFWKVDGEFYVASVTLSEFGNLGYRIRGVAKVPVIEIRVRWRGKIINQTNNRPDQYLMEELLGELSPEVRQGILRSDTLKSMAKITGYSDGNLSGNVDWYTEEVVWTIPLYLVATQNLMPESTEGATTEDSSLLEARGGVEEAWKSFYRRKLSSFKIEGPFSFSYEEHSARWSSDPSKKVYVADGDFTVLADDIEVRGNFVEIPISFPGTFTPAPTSPTMERSITQYFYGYHFLKISAELQKVLGNGSYRIENFERSKNIRGEEVVIFFISIKDKVAKNEFPEIEEGLRLEEARGGVEEAWKLYLQQQLKNHTYKVDDHISVPDPFSTRSLRVAVKGTLKLDVEKAFYDDGYALIIPVIARLSFSDKRGDVLQYFKHLVHTMNHGFWKSIEGEQFFTLEKLDDFFGVDEHTIDGAAFSVGVFLGNKIRNNVYPKGELREDIQLEESLLSEARGGVEEAWRKYAETVWGSFSYPVKDYPVRQIPQYSPVFKMNLTEATATGEVLFSAAEIDDERGQLVLRFKGDFTFSEKMTPEDEGKATDSVMIWLYSDSSFWSAVKKFNKRFSDRFSTYSTQNGRSRDNGRVEIFYKFNNITKLVSANEYPPAMKEGLDIIAEGGDLLLEARGGVEEAWRQAISKAVENLTLPIDEDFGKGKRITGKATFITEKAEITSRKDVLIPLELDVEVPEELKRKVWERELRNRLGSSADKEFWEIIDSSPLIRQHSILSAIDSIGDKTYIEFYTSSRVNSQQYPKDTPLREGLLTEARGGVVEAWVQYLNSTIKKRRVKMDNGVGVLFAGCHAKDSGDFPVIVFTFELQNENKTSIKDREFFLSVNKYDIKSKFFSPTGTQQKYVYKFLVDYIASVKQISGGYSVGTDERGVTYLQISIPASEMVAKNEYPPNMQNESVLPLNEARGGIAQAWVKYLRNALKGFKLPVEGKWAGFDRRYSTVTTYQYSGDIVPNQGGVYIETDSGSDFMILSLIFKGTVKVTYEKYGEESVETYTSDSGIPHPLDSWVANEIIAVYKDALETKIARYKEVREYFVAGGTYDSDGISVINAKTIPEQAVLEDPTFGRLQVCINNNIYPPTNEAYLQEARGDLSTVWLQKIEQAIDGWECRIKEDVQQGTWQSGKFSSLDVRIFVQKCRMSDSGPSAVLYFEVEGEVIDSEGHSLPVDDHLKSWVLQKYHIDIADSISEFQKFRSFRRENGLKSSVETMGILVYLKDEFKSNTYPVFESEALPALLQEARGGVKEAWRTAFEEEYRDYTYEIDGVYANYDVSGKVSFKSATITPDNNIEVFFEFSGNAETRRDHKKITGKALDSVVVYVMSVLKSKEEFRSSTVVKKVWRNWFDTSGRHTATIIPRRSGIVLSFSLQHQLEMNTYPTQK